MSKKRSFSALFFVLILAVSVYAKTVAAQSATESPVAEMAVLARKQRQALRDMIRFLDKNGVDYYRLTEAGQKLVHVSSEIVRGISGNVLDCGNTMSAPAAVITLSDSISSDELRVYVLGSFNGTMEFKDVYATGVNATGYVFAADMEVARDKGQEILVSPWMGERASHLWPDSNSTIDPAGVYVIPFTSLMGQREHVLLEFLERFERLKSGKDPVLPQSETF